MPAYSQIGYLYFTVKWLLRAISFDPSTLLEYRTFFDARRRTNVSLTTSMTYDVIIIVVTIKGSNDSISNQPLSLALLGVSSRVAIINAIKNRYLIWPPEVRRFYFGRVLFIIGVSFGCACEKGTGTEYQKPLNDCGIASFSIVRMYQYIVTNNGLYLELKQRTNQSRERLSKVAAFLRLKNSN